MYPWFVANFRARTARVPTGRRFRTFACAALLVAAACAQAQFATPPGGTQIRDSAALKPPPGSRVAIVEFADLQCPACGLANPVLKAAVAKYKIPWIRHDFLIPYHNWSRDAAVNARWFDLKSKALGNEYRDQVFAAQAVIYNPMLLHQFTAKFAQANGVVLPPDVDPQGKLNAEVQADSELAKRTGIVHTPTIFVVTANSKGAPFIEVLRPEDQLDQILGQAVADTTPAKPAKVVKTGKELHQ